MNTLILYYSHSGNTRSIAEKMAQTLGCDSCEIQMTTPYTGNYDTVVAQGQREVAAGYEPPIQPLSKSPAAYDTVILGMPVWWYTFAPAVKTALSAIDWKGKTVYPFATNGGWIGHTFRDIAQACAGADVKKGLNIRFEDDRLVTSQADIDRWVASLYRPL